MMKKFFLATALAAALPGAAVAQTQGQEPGVSVTLSPADLKRLQAYLLTQEPTQLLVMLTTLQQAALKASPTAVKGTTSPEVLPTPPTSSPLPSK